MAGVGGGTHSLAGAGSWSDPSSWSPGPGAKRTAAEAQLSPRALLLSLVPSVGGPASWPSLPFQFGRSQTHFLFFPQFKPVFQPSAMLLLHPCGGQTEESHAGPGTWTTIRGTGSQHQGRV